MKDNELFEIFENRLYDLMRIKKINGVSQLAEVSNISQSTLSTILNKKRIPKLSLINSICEGLDISLYDFFNSSLFKNDRTDTINAIDKLNDEEIAALNTFIQLLTKD